MFANPYIPKYVEVLINYRPNNETRFVVLRLFSAMTSGDFVIDSNVQRLMRETVNWCNSPHLYTDTNTVLRMS